MNEYDNSTPAPTREWVPADFLQDDEQPDLLAAAVEAAANYAYGESE